MQSFLSISALVLVTFLAVGLFSWVGRTEDHGYYVDAVQEIRAVNIDILDYLQTLSFDQRTLGDEAGDSTYVAPADASELTSTGSAEWGAAGCTLFDKTSCDDIDDYDGKTIQRSLSFFEISITVDVVYVERDNPDVESASQTFAKDVRLSVSSPMLKHWDVNVADVNISRIFTAYHKQTPPSGGGGGGGGGGNIN